VIVWVGGFGVELGDCRRGVDADFLRVRTDDPVEIDPSRKVFERFLLESFDFLQLDFGAFRNLFRRQTGAPSCFPQFVPDTHE
jgi:hypothetical protein